MNQLPAILRPCLLLLATLLLGPLAPNTPADDFDVTWDSPSTNHHGSMPLGNGDIALNAWFTPGGDLHFYIAKADAWDDNARLVKVGKVRVHLDPNPFTSTATFRQALKLREGALTIDIGRSPADATPALQLRLWVDAHHPTIHLTATSTSPLEITSSIEPWRTNQQELAELQISDVMMNPAAPDKKHGPTLIEPDTVLDGLQDQIGWYHHNRKSVGPRLLAEVQGLTGFPQPDPLLHRTFGAVLQAVDGKRLDHLHLRSPRGTHHCFTVFVLTQHPATPGEWFAALDQTRQRVEATSFNARRRAHEAWWSEFWERSWIRATSDPEAPPTASTLVPDNSLPVQIGVDQAGGNRFTGQLGRLTILQHALTDAEIARAADPAHRAAPLARLVEQRPDPAVAAGLPFAGTNLAPGKLAESESWRFNTGVTLEAWVQPQATGAASARLVDKITPGGNNGFLLDAHPGNSLRFICGDAVLQHPAALAPGRWTHVAAVADTATGQCRLYVDGRRVAASPATGGGDDAAHVSRMYALQRYVTACAGRGAYPIKFNGSLFTVPPGPTEQDPDYRRWGPGYWWQNTRLPYISLCTSGDFDLQRPLFRMYAEDLLPLCKYRTRHYLGHAGAFYPECIMFWGAVFSETYGWTPFEQRQDKLQESGWHKWEWVGGLELCWMMLDYYDHTLDQPFLRGTVLPFTREILTFFDQHYPTNAQGQLVMHPSQALETWWRCTNAAPELAGCIAVTERLLQLPDSLVPPQDQGLARQLRAKLPPIPLREVQGRKALAPAEFFSEKPNIENPELYAVFPFRLFAFNRPHLDWALAALEHRWDRGHSGWRQDDIFMAYLGLAEPARQGLVSRARAHDPGERFPAFWGPNYDWTPDQDHGGVLMKTLQSMLLQTDGDKILLLPAWPRGWNVDFKLHAPRQTVVEGAFHNGRLVSLKVTPESRKADVQLPAP